LYEWGYYDTPSLEKPDPEKAESLRKTNKKKAIPKQTNGKHEVTKKSQVRVKNSKE